MTASAHQEVIASLLEMAERGEIDPWDVAVIEVMDRFLQDLGILDSLDLAYQQRHLPRSGQAFLWASLLVRYKADTLERLESPPAPEEDILELEEEDGAAALGLPANLERRLRRRTAVPPLQKRRVTLQELIEEIQEIAAEIEKNEAQPRKVKRNRPQSRREALQLITELAHQENLTEVAAQLEQFLQSRYGDDSPDSPEDVDLDTLLAQWRAEQDSPEGLDRVGVFWALLLLSSQSKVSLSQAVFYQDLRVRVLEPDPRETPALST
ncbi:MAG: segregation/condensation protein A [Cyanobacteriota bacterium]|jgi:segregation and condensation protein A